MSHVDFDRRVNKIARRAHDRANGVTPRLSRSGVIELEPRKRSVLSRLRLAPLLMAGAGLVIYKAFLLSNLGVESYVARLEGLAAGDLVQRVGGFLMQVDPVTSLVAGYMVPIVG